MNVDIVLDQQLLDLAAGDVGLGLVVGDHDLDRPAIDAAVLVDAVDRHLQADQRGLAAERAARRRAAAPSRSCTAWPAPKAACHGAGTSMVAPSAPPSRPSRRRVRRVALPLYQKSCAHSSSFHFSVITSPPSGFHSVPISARGMRSRRKSASLIWKSPSPPDAPAARLATRAAVRAVTARPCPTARRGISNPSPAGPWRALRCSLANAIRHQVSTAISILMDTNSHGRMLPQDCAGRSKAAAAMLACRNNRTGMASMAVSPLRKEQRRIRTAAWRRGARSAPARHRGPTAGLAPGNVQGNLAILPQALAADFLRFCQLNPKPCPLIGTSAPGDPRVPELGRGSRHPHRPAALPGLEKRRARRRAAGHPRLLARRPGELRDRLLVFVRGSADGGRHRAAPHHARLQRADVPHLDRHERGGPLPWTDGRVDAAADAAPTRSARCRSPRAFRRCTARRCISASRS